MRLPLLISSAALVVPLAASSQVVEHERMPRGYNKHPITSAPGAGRGGDTDLDPAEPPPTFKTM